MARILIVDDDEAVREMIATLLRDLGHEVFMASNSVAGIELIPRIRPNLVTTDVQNRPLSGLEVAKAARLRRPPTPVLVVSGGGYEDEAINAGACAFLAKPFLIDDLVEAVVHALTT